MRAVRRCAWFGSAAILRSICRHCAVFGVGRDEVEGKKRTNFASDWRCENAKTALYKINVGGGMTHIIADSNGKVAIFKLVDFNDGRPE